MTKFQFLRAVPQPADRHRQEQIGVGADVAVAIPAQRDVEIVAQPGRQADVPAPPEILDRHRQIRVAEILGVLEAEHAPEADRHRAVAGEVEEDLSTEKPYIASNASGALGTPACA